MNQIYLDYNATTPVDTAVADVMIPYITDFYGNPSSAHSYGYKTRIAVEKAREQVALMLNCYPDEVIFTSGGTESNNMAITGVMFANQKRGKHLIISAIEHPAVAEVARSLELQGLEVSRLPVDSFGRVSPKDLESMIRSDTVMISVMHANNETGTIQPIRELARVAHKHHLIFHTDAAQSVGKIPADVRDLDVDLLSIAGHKLYAPKGIGALYVKRGIVLQKFMHGANHESDMRPGTENVCHIVALGKAAELINENLAGYAMTLRQTRDQLYRGLSKHFPDMRINGHPDLCLPNTLNVSFKDTAAFDIISHLKDIAVSAGAACHSSSGSSGTLDAMNLPPEFSHGALRLTTGRFTSEAEIEQAIIKITEAVNLARNNHQRFDSNHLILMNQDKEDAYVSKSGATTTEMFITYKQPEKQSFKQSDINLTGFDPGMGCGCKIKPAALEYLLSKIASVMPFPSEVLVGHETGDDAAVWKINEDTAIVQTVDFFTPMVNDPYTFGAIAAANALSDIYAMGGKPLFALNMVAFPVSQLPLDTLKEIMQGASDKAAEAGVVILGGHSIEDTGIKFGMVVTGTVTPDRVLRNTGCLPGDVLILTKPLGTGVISKALAMGMLEEAEITAQDYIKSMVTLNKSAADIISHYPVTACTDVTGFGLAGHLHEMLIASGVDAELNFNQIPFLEGAIRLAAAGAIPGSTRSNEDFAKEWLDAGALKPFQKSLICDSQTSGGLLISLREEFVEPMLNDLKEKGVEAQVIGQITTYGKGEITIRHSS